MECEKCNNEHDGSYGSGRFCCSSCARSFSSLVRKEETNKKISEKLKGRNDYIWNRGTGKPKKPKKIKLKDSVKFCKWCGQEECKRINICRKHQIFPSLIKYFGMSSDVIGSQDLYREYEKTIEVIRNLYHDREMSLPLLAEYFNYSNDIRNFNKILNSIGIKKRTRSKSLSNAVKNGRLSVPTNFIYKSGHHITWEGKRVFLRSSYEFDYANYLDGEQVRYDVENLRLQYWDSQLLRNRIAIPDFHITDTNMIVEIKSNYTLDMQNMVDKKNYYEKAGYKVKVILEGKEMPL